MSATVNAQDSILRACQHSDRQHDEVQMEHGETLQVCCDCWNASVAARRAERKAQLAEFWQRERTKQTCAMNAVGARPGDRVHIFLHNSLILFYTLELVGTIKLNRNSIAVIKLDAPYQGRAFVPWSKEWHTL